MPCRKVPLETNEIYHIYSRSIADYKVFRSKNDYERMIGLMSFYIAKEPPCKYSAYKKLFENTKIEKMKEINSSEKNVEIISYCIMSNDFHMVLKQISENGIVEYMNMVLKSYSKYFNEKYERKGPLWEGRFKNVLVKSDEQIIHLTRYIHLNPVTAYMVKKPEMWDYSSYNEYIGRKDESNQICKFSDYMNIDNSKYQEFVNEWADYQRELNKIENLTLE